MEIKSAQHLNTAVKTEDCPVPDKPEFAFTGRSNVGKSSLINMLINRKSLARTSGSPGKTQTINHYLINDEWYLVDLPGYGYAKVSKTSRIQWKRMIRHYLINRPNMECLFVLIDSRLKPQQNDIDFISLLGEEEIPFVIVFTKADKIKQKEVEQNIDRFAETLSEKWEALPQFFITSAKKHKGKKAVLEFIDGLLSSI